MNTAVAEIENPFAHAAVAARPKDAGGVIATQAAAREMAEVQAAMANARHFPRVEVEVMDQILQACTRQSLAEGALYEYARGGTDIRGPSIKLAETIAQKWGHIDYGWRVLEERPGVTKVQTFAWDLQTGTRSQVVFDVTHERKARGATQSITDPRDLYEHIANNASRRLRACLLRVVPGDVVEAAVRQCEKTLVTKVEVTPERLKGMCEQFGEYGITKAMIEKRIQRRLEACTPGIMLQLGKIFTSLRDNMSAPGDWFDLAEGQVARDRQEGPGENQAPPSTNKAVKARLDARKQAAGPPPEQAKPSNQGAAGQMSEALQDVIRFARAAANKEDIERAAQIAMQLEGEAEMMLAQEHLDAARERLGVGP